MSASAPSSPSQLEAPNKFTLHDEQRTTQVTYYPLGSGPIISGKTQAGPKLEYAGEEGNLTFSGNQIESTESPMGSLIGVILRPDADAGGLSFTLILPRVSETQGGNGQHFRAVGIKTKTRGFVIAPGADRTYTVLHLHGLAEKVELPM